MNRSQAYQILGLHSGADEQEIRKRYKKLAMKVHPDINPDPNAHEEFIRLSLAVECLLRPQTEETTQRRTSRAYQKKEDAGEEIKARMEEAKMRYEEQKRKNFEENQRYFQSLLTGRKWKVFRVITWVGVLLSAIIVLDAFLPVHLEKDELNAYSSIGHNGIKEDRIYMVYLERTGDYFAESNLGAWVSSYPEVIIEKTWILHSPISFYSSDDFFISKTQFDFDLLSIRWYVAVLLLFPLLPYFRRKMNIQFVFFYQFSLWVVGLMELYILFGHFRIVHILSLGFL